MHWFTKLLFEGHTLILEFSDKIVVAIIRKKVLNGIMLDIKVHQMRNVSAAIGCRISVNQNVIRICLLQAFQCLEIYHS